MRHLQFQPQILSILATGIFILSFHANQAQVANFPVGARAAGMCGSSVASGDVWASFNNPALLADIDRISAGINYENRFLIKELGFNSITAAFPLRPGTLGIAFRQYGSQHYSETFAGLAFGRSFGDRFNAGVRLDAYHTRLGENYGNRTMLSFALGISADLTDNLILAAALFNPLRFSWAKDFNETIPTVFRTGMAYRVDDNILLTIEAEKDSRHKPALRFGAEYSFADMAVLRGGLGTNPTAVSFGIGLHIGRIFFDISAMRHEVLGYSPNAGITWQAK